MLESAVSETDSRHRLNLTRN